MTLRPGSIHSSRLLIYAAEILLLSVCIGGFRYVWRYHLLGPPAENRKALRDRLFLTSRRFLLLFQPDKGSEPDGPCHE